MTAAALGFDRPTANSLDSVADRDFALEVLSAAAIAAVHLSRLAEEIVLWTTVQFGFVKLSDAFSTGSSIMPQKRNPDAAELVRGKAGRIIGALNALLITMKGLPLTYSKDMQEDKEPTFDALMNFSLVVAAMAGMVRDLTPDEKRMKAAAGAGYATATDLADWLVRARRMPFREAHHVTARIVGLAAAKGVGLEKLSLAEMRSVHEAIGEEVFAVWASTNRSRAARATAARRPPMCGVRRGNGSSCCARPKNHPDRPPNSTGAQRRSRPFRKRRRNPETSTVGPSSIHASRAGRRTCRRRLGLRPPRPARASALHGAGPGMGQALWPKPAAGRRQPAGQRPRRRCRG